MSIEALLTSLKESIDRNTEALNRSAGTTTAADKTTKTTKTDKAEKKDEPKVTQDEMNAALIKIKDDFGMPEAKAIISKVGGVERMGDIKPAKYQEVYAAAVAKHAELTEAAEKKDPDDL